MAGSIRIHPTLGLNPAVDHCFWCDAAVGVALLGNNRGQEAPPKVISSYAPCDGCKENRAKGITIVECVDKVHSDNPEIQDGIAPTGRWSVIKEEAVERIFGPDNAAKILKARMAFLEKGAIPQLFEQEVPTS